MKRILLVGLFTLLIAGAFSPITTADSRASKICKQKYKAAVRGAKYLRSRQRKERIEQARKELEECEKMAKESKKD